MFFYLTKIGLNFQLKNSEIRNTIKVEVKIENIMNISLSQGQYQAIVNLTQQNFSEEQHFVPEIYPIPIFKTVNLQVKIFTV